MSFRKKVERLQDQIGDAIQENRSLLETAEKEDRDLTADEQKGYDQNEEKIEDLIATKQRYQKQMDREEWLEEIPADRRFKKPDPGDAGDHQERNVEGDYAKSFEAFMRYGRSNLTPEERQALGRKHVKFDSSDVENMSETERRALTTATGSSGGYTIPEGFRQRIYDAMKLFGGMRESGAEILQTEMGNTIPLVTGDDTDNKGELLGENTQVSEQDLTFGVKNLEAFKFSSKMVRVPIELLQDNAVNLEEHLEMKLGERLGRIINQYDTTGTGSNQPEGVQASAVSGLTAASATAITYDELVNDLFHSVDPAYRSQGARYMFNDNTLSHIKQLKDGNSRPYFAEAGDGVLRNNVGGADLRYVLNQDMPDIATGVKPVLYGAFRYYIIRDVMNMTLLRLEERYADYHQVAFLAVARHDGKYVNPDTSDGPIKALTMN